MSLTPLAKVSPGAKPYAHSLRIATSFSATRCANPHALICAPHRGAACRAAASIDSLIVPIAGTWLSLLRERTVAPSRSYRLVFGESDGLAEACQLDRYGDIIVGQIAIARRGNACARRIEERSARCWRRAASYWKNDSGARDLRKQLDSVAEMAFGEVPEEVEVIEAGLRFVAPLAHGQKIRLVRTDQTANRARLARYPVGRGARARRGAAPARAWAVTAAVMAPALPPAWTRPETALAYVKRNAAGQWPAGRHPRVGCVRRPQASCDEQGERFDVVIVDPPALHQAAGRTFRRAPRPIAKLRPARHEPDRARRAARELLVQLSPVGRGSHRRHPGGGPP